MAHVFVSYSKRNKDYVLKLVEKLLDEGFDVWIDNRRLRSSEDWWRSIVEALRDCSAFIVVMTPESDSSEWVQLEITLAIKYKKPRFPVWLSGSMDTPNWAIFARTQYTDATNGQLPPPTFYEDLAQHVRRKPHRGSTVTATGRLDQKITMMIEQDPVLQEALQNPPQVDMDDDDDIPVIQPPVRRRSLLPIIAGVAVLLLLVAAGLIVPRVITPIVTPTSTPTPTTEVTSEPASPTPDLTRQPVTLENLNAWRVQQGYPTLTTNTLLTAIAERHMDFLSSLTLTELENLDSLERNGDQQTPQEVAEAAGYSGKVEMIVPVPQETALELGDLIFQMETEGGQDIHRNFSEIGYAAIQSLTTGSYYYLIVLGSPQE